MSDGEPTLTETQMRGLLARFERLHQLDLPSDPSGAQREVFFAGAKAVMDMLGRQKDEQTLEDECDRLAGYDPRARRGTFLEELAKAAGPSAVKVWKQGQEEMRQKDIRGWPLQPVLRPSNLKK